MSGGLSHPANLGARLRRTARLPDSNVVFAFLASLWSTLSGLVLLLLVTWRLTPAEQGYYFTFASLLLVQLFVELGFGIVLTQFVSHEWASLRLTGAGRVEGEPVALARLGSLVRLGRAWYGGVALLYFGLVGGAGHLLFSLTGAAAISWTGAWWLLTGMASLAVLAVPLSSLIEGSGRVGRNQATLLAANLCGGIAAWTALLSGAGLYSLAVLFGVRALVALPLLLLAARPFLRLSSSAGEGVSWRREFWPQQWRVSVSWAAGFVMFQSLTPVLFMVRGPIAAGQIGATLQVFHAINRLSSAWLIAVQPRFGRLGAFGRLDAVRRLVRETMMRAVATAVVLAATALAVLAAARSFLPGYADRFAGLEATALFLVALTALQAGNVATTAVRFQKREPFVVAALTGALLIAITTAALGWRLGIDGVAIGFAATILGIILPWTLWIARRELASEADARAPTDVRPGAGAAVVVD